MLGICLLNDHDGNKVIQIEQDNNYKQPEPTMRAIFQEWLESQDYSWSILIKYLQRCNFNNLAKDVKDALIENRISFYIVG